MYKNQLPFHPWVSVEDSSIFDFGHIHCCKLGCHWTIQNKWQTVLSQMRRLIMSPLIWLCSVCKDLCFGPEAERVTHHNWHEKDVSVRLLSNGMCRSYIAVDNIAQSTYYFLYMYLHGNTCCFNSLEVLLRSTNNRCFHGEIRKKYIEDIYSFTVNTINIVIEWNENISIFTSAKHEWKFECFHYTRWKFLWYFYFIVHMSMCVSDVISNVTKQNMNIMASTLSA